MYVTWHGQGRRRGLFVAQIPAFDWTVSCKTAIVAHRNSALILPRRSLCPKCYTVSPYTCERKFIDGHKRSTGFSAAAFEKLKNSSVVIYRLYEALHPRRKINAESTDGNLPFKHEAQTALFKDPVRTVQ